MEQDDDCAVIIVMPLRYPALTKGRKCECENCDQEAWLSDTSIDAVKELTPSKPVKLICADCISAFMKKNNEGEINIMKPTDAQLDEIRNHS